MREWYTQERVCEVLHHAYEFGINAFNFVSAGAGSEEPERFPAEGGRMHRISQVSGDDAAIAKRLKPLARHRQGELVEFAWRAGEMASLPTGARWSETWACGSGWARTSPK
jgi:hypothetical protein